MRIAFSQEKYHDYTVPQFSRASKRENGAHKLYEFEPYLGYKFSASVAKNTLTLLHQGSDGLPINGPWPPQCQQSKCLRLWCFDYLWSWTYRRTDYSRSTARVSSKARATSLLRSTTSEHRATIRPLNGFQFANMLAQGLKPDIAVFVDGNLDSWFWSDDPPLSGEMRETYGRSRIWFG